MTEKNIFAYKLFLPLNISDFSGENLFMWIYFYVKIATLRPWKKSPPATLSKCWGPVKSTFLKTWLEAQPAPPLQKGGQVPNMLQCFFVAGFILFQVGPTPSRCFQFPPGSCGFPHEKINRCLTDINQCLTDIFKI